MRKADDVMKHNHDALMSAVAEADAGQQAVTETQLSPEQEQPVAEQTTIYNGIETFSEKISPIG